MRAHTSRRPGDDRDSVRALRIRHVRLLELIGARLVIRRAAFVKDLERRTN
jgi:hypothetical protein